MSNFKNSKIQRRQFLKGASGITVAIPFLPSLAKADPSDNVNPRYAILCPSANGHIGYYFYPKPEFRSQAVQTDPTYKTLDLRNLPSNAIENFGNLYGLRQHLNILKGVHSLSSNYGDHSSEQIFTGFIWKNFLGNIFFESQNPSIDYIMARYGYGNFNPLFNLVHMKSEEAPSFQWRPANYSQVPTLNSSSIQFIWGQLFGGLSGGGNLAEIRKANQVSLIVDQLLPDYQRTKSIVNAPDRQVLDAHMESLFQIQNQIVNSPNLSQCTQPPNNPPLYDWQNTDLVGHSKLLADLIVAAIRCDMSRVFVLNMAWSDAATGRDPRFGYGYHGVSHGTDEASGILFNNIKKAQLEVVAHLAQRLNQLIHPVTGRTLLDHSGIFYMNDIGNKSGGDTLSADSYVYETHVHTNREMLCMSVGSFGGTLRTGYFVDYGRPPSREGYDQKLYGRAYNNYLMTILHGMGIDPAQYETTPGIGEYTGCVGLTAANHFCSTDEEKRAPLPFYFAG